MSMARGVSGAALLRGGTVLEQIGEKCRSFILADSAGAFTDRQDIADFDGEVIRSEQFMKTVVVVVAQTDRLIGVGLRDQPFEADGGVNDVLHRPSRME